ncbi:MAG: hypothetical protein Q7S68_03385, partial [Deltaproteobacteria bacterium]|nr:hypothetical protein [Deltaproteobacteria bacterium]
LSLTLPSDRAEKDRMIVETVTEGKGFELPKLVEEITTPEGERSRKEFSTNACDRSADIQTDVPAPGKQQKKVICDETTVTFERNYRATGPEQHRVYEVFRWKGTYEADGKPPQAIPDSNEDTIGIVRVGDTSIIGYNTAAGKIEILEEDYYVGAPYSPLFLALRGALSFVHGDGSANVPLVLDSEGFDRLSPEARREYEGHVDDSEKTLQENSGNGIIGNLQGTLHPAAMAGAPFSGLYLYADLAAGFAGRYGEEDQWLAALGFGAGLSLKELIGYNPDFDAKLYVDLLSLTLANQTNMIPQAFSGKHIGELPVIGASVAFKGWEFRLEHRSTHFDVPAGVRSSSHDLGLWIFAIGRTFADHRLEEEMQSN